MKHDELTELKGGAVVSKLGLGTAQLGGLYSSISDDEGQPLIDAAIEKGIKYFDTAPHYGSSHLKSVVYLFQLVTSLILLLPMQTILSSD